MNLQSIDVWVGTEWSTGEYLQILHDHHQQIIPKANLGGERESLLPRDLDRPSDFDGKPATNRKPRK